MKMCAILQSSLGMLLGILVALILQNMFSGKEVPRAGKGVIRPGKDKSIAHNIFRKHSHD